MGNIFFKKRTGFLGSDLKVTLGDYKHRAFFYIDIYRILGEIDLFQFVEEDLVMLVFLFVLEIQIQHKTVFTEAHMLFCTDDLRFAFTYLLDVGINRIEKHQEAKDYCAAAENQALDSVIKAQGDQNSAEKQQAENEKLIFQAVIFTSEQMEIEVFGIVLLEI